MSQRVTLDSLSPYVRRTFILLLRYFASRQQPQACLTYQGVRGWFFYALSRQDRDGLEWHTVERGIRALAELGVLRRLRRGRRVVFCKTDAFYQLTMEYRRKLEGARLPEGSPYRSLLEYLEQEVG